MFCKESKISVNAGLWNLCISFYEKILFLFNWNSFCSFSWSGKSTWSRHPSTCLSDLSTIKFSFWQIASYTGCLQSYMLIPLLRKLQNNFRTQGEYFSVSKCTSNRSSPCVSKNFKALRKRINKKYSITNFIHYIKIHNKKRHKKTALTWLWNIP